MRPAVIEFWVPGIPRPQGSKRHVGGGRMIESSKYLPAWRRAVTLSIAGKGYIGGSVELGVTFYMPHNATSRKEGRIHAYVSPDLSKLIRAVEDSITDAGLWDDDARVVKCTAVKIYETDRGPGVNVTIKAIASA